MIFTSYFARQRKMELDDAAYISIAVGNPKYPVPYEIVDLKALKPYGIFNVYEGEMYKKKYFERLDSYGVDYIMQAIKRAQGNHKHAILMCHEKDSSECHRRLFAEWWMLRTGEIIEELGEQPKQVEPECEQLSLFCSGCK